MELEIENICISELPLSQTASYLMDYNDPLMKVVGDKLVVGYLADDEYPSNPFEDGCFDEELTPIADADSHLLEKIGLKKEYGEITYSFPEILKHGYKIYRKKWSENASKHKIFRDFVQHSHADSEFSDEFYLRYAQLYVDQHYEEDLMEEYDWDATFSLFDISENAMIETWKFLHSNHLINPDHVLTTDGEARYDVDISVISDLDDLSISEIGYIWHHNGSEYVKSAMDSEASVLAHGYIKFSALDKGFAVFLDSDPKPSPNKHVFETYKDAFAFLANHAEHVNISIKPRVNQNLCSSIGCHRAATERAEIFLETYNHYLSGRVYGVIVDVFSIDATDPDDIQYEIIDDFEGSVWGFCGDEYALTEMQNQFDYSVNYLEKEKNKLQVAA